MIGCMVGTSLSMAPALMIGAMSRWVDLDGPLLLGSDRYPALTYDNGVPTWEGKRILPDDPIPELQ